MAQSEKGPAHPKIFSRKVSARTRTASGGGGVSGAVPEEVEAVTEDIMGAISSALAVVSDPAVTGVRYVPGPPPLAVGRWPLSRGR